MINDAAPRRVCVSADAIAQPGKMRCSTGLKIPAQDYKSIRNVQRGYCDVATLIRKCCQNEIVDYATVTLGDKLLFRKSELLTMTLLVVLILMDPQGGCRMRRCMRFILTGLKQNLFLLKTPNTKF